MINNIDLIWMNQGQYFEPPRGGLVVLADDTQGIFGNPPSIKIKPVKKGAGGRTITEQVGLFIGVDMPKEYQLPDRLPPVKLVGDRDLGTGRRVIQYIGKESGLDFRFGLTVHEAAGTWSSEPHDFEMKSFESLKPMPFWEKFAYMTDPPHGWGIQTRLGMLGNSLVKDITLIGDRGILQIPLGTHPVTAGPGVVLAYFWIYQAEDITLAEKF